MSDKTTNGSSPPGTLTADDHERLFSLISQTLLQVERIARIQASGQQIDARRQMAWADVMERVERAIKRLGASSSLAVVSDMPQIVASTSRRDEVSVVNLRLPVIGMVPVPNRWLRWALSWVIGSATGGGLIHWLHTIHVLQ